MRLTELKGTIHGVHVDLALHHPCHLITGPNAAGKSTTLNAVRCLLETQRPSDHPKGMDITGTWSDPNMVARRAILDGKHMLRVGVGSGFDQGIKAAQMEVDGYLGQAWAWDTSAFLSLSPAKRTAMLEDHKVLRLDHPLSVAHKHLADAGLHPDEMETLRATMHTSFHQARTAQIGLDTLVNDLRAEWRKCNASVRQIEAAAKQAEQAVTAAHLPAGTVPQWEEKAQQASDRLAELKAKKAAGDAERRARAAIERELQQVTQERKRIEGRAARAKQLLHDLSKVESDIKTNAAERDEVDEKVNRLKEKAEAMEAQIASLVRQLRESRELYGAAQATQKAFAACAGVFEPLQRVRAVELLWKREEEQPPWAADLREALHALANLEVAKAVDLAELETEGRGMAEEESGLRSKRAAHARVQRAMWAQREKLAAKKGSLLATRDSIKGDLADLRKEDTDTEAVSARMEELRTQLADGGGNDSTLDQAIAEAEQQRDKARDNVAALQGAAALRATAAERSSELQRVTSTRTQARKWENMARKAQGAYLAQAAAPLMEVASATTQAVLGMPLTLDLDGGTHLRLGDQFIEHRSHSEGLVSALALHIAVVSKLPGWRVALLDDMESVEAPRRQKLYEHLARLCDQGVLDNAIVALVGDDAAPAGWGHTAMVRP
jgi:energy-coupling factor transporter ATP-binding protein EcfA2